MGSYLISPDVNIEYIYKKKYILSTVRGLRRTQEDGHICQEYNGGVLICIFDGHGGPYVSKYLQDFFVQYIDKQKQAFSTKYMDYIMGEALKSVDEDLEKDSSLLRQYLDPSIPLDISKNIADNMGSTAICAYIKNNIVYVSSVGDSQCYIIDKNGKVSFEHKKHDLKNKTEKKRLENLGAEIDDDGYIIYMNQMINMTRSIGDHCFKKSNGFLTSESWKGQYSLSNSDSYILVGCDGVWDFISPSQIFEHIKNNEGKSLIKISNEILLDIIKKKKGSDNITLSIYRL